MLLSAHLRYYNQDGEFGRFKFVYPSLFILSKLRKKSEQPTIQLKTVIIIIIIKSANCHTTKQDRLSRQTKQQNHFVLMVIDTLPFHRKYEMQTVIVLDCHSIDYRAWSTIGLLPLADMDNTTHSLTYTVAVRSEAYRV